MSHVPGLAALLTLMIPNIVIGCLSRSSSAFFAIRLVQGTILSSLRLFPLHRFFIMDLSLSTSILDLKDARELIELTVQLAAEAQVDYQ